MRVRDELTDEHLSFFHDQGYLTVEGAIEDSELPHVQEEFYRVEEATRDDWQRDLAENVSYRPYRMCETAHVVAPIVTQGDVFLDLMEHPQTIGITETLMGPDMMMHDNALHVKPAGTKSHTDWHKDSPTWDFDPAQWDEGDRELWASTGACDRPFLKVKIFFFVEDVDEDTAPFSVVPGSHKAETNEVPKYDPLEDMPNHVRLTGKAGDAILWNGRIWHTAMDNTGPNIRRMLLYNYRHFGMKRTDVYDPDEALKDQLQGRSALCRQLFGVERMQR